MDSTVAKLNIEHFRKLLETEKDSVKRATILALLSEEEAKLKAFEEDPRRRNEK